MRKNLSKVSVIVPTYNSGEYLEECLQSILEQSYQNIELIVVDNNSIDNTKEIAKKYTNNVFDKKPERSAQRNYGVQKSSGKYILFIDSDMVLSKNVIKSCIENIGNGINAITIPEESFGIGFWAQCKKLERSFYTGVDWMEAARFFTKQSFEKVNGYNECITGAEDYDLPQRIAYAYGDNSIGRINAIIYHNEQKLSLWKTCKKKFYYAQGIHRYRSVDANIKNFKKQVSVIQRYKLFLSNPSRLYKNPLVSLGMFFMKTCEFSCGGMGIIFNKLKK